MKRLYIIVEGQSEQEFVNTLIADYLSRFGIYAVTSIVLDNLTLATFLNAEFGFLGV